MKDILIQKKKIDDSSIVCFSVYETLVNCDVMNINNIYKKVSNRLDLNYDYSARRLAAQDRANREKPFFAESVNIYDVFDVMARMFNISKNEIEKLKETELAVIYENTSIRKYAKELYDYCFDTNKKVILVESDFYPEQFTKKILNKCGYNSIDNLYTFSDLTNKGKSNVLSKIVTNCDDDISDTKQILYIGSHYSNDYKLALKHSLSAILLKTPLYMFEKQGQTSSLIKQLDYNTSQLLIRNINSELDKFFIEKDIDHASMGYIFLGPLVLQYALNVVKIIERKNISKVIISNLNHRMFISLLKQLLDRRNKDGVSSKVEIVEVGNIVGEKGINGLEEYIHDENVNSNNSLEWFIKNILHIEKEDEQEHIYKIFRRIGYRTKESKIGKFENYYDILDDLEVFWQKNIVEKRTKILRKINENISCDDSVLLCQFDENTQLFDEWFKDKENGYSKYVFITTKDLAKSSAFIYKKFTGLSHINSIISALNHYITTDCNTENTILSDVNSSVLEFIGVYLNENSIKPGQKILNENLMVELMSRYVAKLNYGELTVEKEIANEETIEDKISENVIDELNEEDENEHLVNRIKSLPLYKYMYLVAHKLGIVPYIKRKLKRGTELDQQKITLDIFEAKFQEGIKAIKDYKITDRDNIVFAGMMLGSTKGVSGYLNKVYKETKEANLIMLSEYGNISLEKAEQRMYLDIFIMPLLISKNYYVDHTKIDTTVDMLSVIKEKQYLKNAVENIKGGRTTLGAGYAEALAYYQYKYFVAFLEHIKPKKVVLWNQFHATNTILMGLCKERNIETDFMEFGVIPGTLVIEGYGQMGESYPSQHSSEFLQLPYTQDEFAETKKVLKFLKETKQNRNIYDKNSKKEDVLAKLKQGRPVIVFAGQYDYEAGLYPYTEHSKLYHSPNFKSSDDTVIYLAKICKKNDWNFIYKPHPLMLKISTIYNNDSMFPPNVIFVTDLDISDAIEISDVLVTLFSQTAYLSLIAEKTTLMLGYNQLRNKGCAYEAYNVEDIEKEMIKAIENGYTEEMKFMFTKHTTQLLRHYLFSDTLKREMYYGQSVSDFKNKLLKGEL